MNEYIEYETAPGISEFGKFLGIEVKEYDRKSHSVRIEWNLSQAHYSRAGKAHGGAIAAVFDALCGLATFTTLDRGDVCSTIEIKINFLAPLEMGEKVTATARVAHFGKRICVVLAEMRAGAADGKSHDGKLVALATGTFNTVRGGKVVAPAAT